MIIKRGKKYHLMSKDGSKNLGGPYSSEEEAKKRERQVSYFKNLHQYISDHAHGFPKK